MRRETIRPHPLYPNDRVKQAKLEALVDGGFINREIVSKTQARYTLMDKGFKLWEREENKADLKAMWEDLMRRASW